MPKHDLSSHHFQRKISDFCGVRIAPIVSKPLLENIRSFLISLIVYRKAPPLLNSRIDWTTIAHTCGLGQELTAELKKQLRLGLDAIIRWLGASPAAKDVRPAKRKARSSAARQQKPATPAPSIRQPRQPGNSDTRPQSASVPRGSQPKPIPPFPDPLFEASQDPAAFQDALVYQMRQFGESCWQLYRAVIRLGETFDDKTLLSWIQGERVPRSVASFGILARIEQRYRLPPGYFKAKLPHQARSLYGARPW